MDLNAYNLADNTSHRWVKVMALFCFALACGLLIGSLAKVHPAFAGLGIPSASLSQDVDRTAPT
jgi:hypothetical protein